MEIFSLYQHKLDAAKIIVHVKEPVLKLHKVVLVDTVDTAVAVIAPVSMNSRNLD